METQKNENKKFSVLSKTEWNVLPALGDGLEWQLVAMLNYEYARCYEPLLKEVEEFRSDKLLGLEDKKKPSIPKTFAHYLASVFPEFPQTPWCGIPTDIRQKRLRDINIDEENGIYVPRKPAWQAWRILSQEAVDVSMHLSTLSETFREKYGVCEIDFMQEDKVIREQFSRWLQQRRAELIAKYDDPVKDPKGLWELNSNAMFKPRAEPEMPRGRNNRKVRCEDFLVSLGWLRIWYHAKHNLDAAAAITSSHISNGPKTSSTPLDTIQGNEGYFNDRQNIDRAELRVSVMMKSLAAAWDQCPQFVLEIEDPNPRVLDNHISGVTYNTSSNLDLPIGAEIKKARSELRNIFTLKYLKYEPMESSKPFKYNVSAIRSPE